MKNFKIILALVGVGKWGQNYLKTVKSIKGCKIKYLSSPHIQNKNFKNKYIFEENYRELINHKDIDGVIIATPQKTHFEVASFFIQNKVNILIEKPLSTKYEEVLMLEKLSKKNKSLVMVGHNYSYHPTIKFIKSELRKIGKMQYITLETGKDILLDTPVLWEWGPHDIGICLDLVSDIPDKISALETQDHNTVFIRLFFRSKIFANIVISSRFITKKRSIGVFGDRGTFVFKEHEHNKLKFYSYLNHKENFIKVNNKQPLVLEVDEFASSIRKRVKPVTDISEVVKIYRLLDKAEDSSKHGGKLIDI